MTETKAPDNAATEDTIAPSSPQRYVTRKFEITTSYEVMERIERFFALLHWNSRHGHSSVFGMALDGDGSDKVTVRPEPDHEREVSLIGGVGGDVECASNNGFYCIFKQKDRKHWRAEDGELRVDGKLHTLYLDKVFPRTVTRPSELHAIAEKLKAYAGEMVDW
jgi:hypothetical protein